MNQKINKTDIESMLFFDGEFVSRHKELDTSSKEFELFQYKNRDRQTDELLSDEETVKLYKKKAALNPIYNRIVALTIAYVKEGVCYYKCLTGTELDITESFYNILSSGRYILVSFNGIGFDCPSIRIAAIRSGCNIPLNEKYNDSGKKTWNITDNHIDLMEVFTGTMYNNFSLDEVCYLMGIESPKNGDIKGSEVTKEYYEKGLEKILSYNKRDVISLVQIVVKLKGIDDLEYVDKTEEVLEIKELSLLERLYEENYLSEDLKEKLSKLLKRKKVLKKDKEVIKDIILSCYIHDNFEIKDQDSKKIKLQKEKEVNEFIESL